jgi:hypothetical protein
MLLFYDRFLRFAHIIFLSDGLLLLTEESFSGRAREFEE